MCVCVCVCVYLGRPGGEYITIYKIYPSYNIAEHAGTMYIDYS